MRVGTPPQVRPDVELRVRDEVNTLIEKELANLKEAYDRDQKAKKAKGKGKKGKKVRAERAPDAVGRLAGPRRSKPRRC